MGMIRIIKMSVLSNSSNQKGFTLIEITAAIAILVIGILSVLALYPVGLVSSKNSEDVFIAQNQSQFIFSELSSMSDSNPPFVASGSYKFQKKFHDNMFFYIYRVDDVSGKPIPGDTANYPADLFYARVAIYRIDCYAGGTATNPATPTGKAIESYGSFIAKED